MMTKEGWIKRKLNGNGVPWNKGKKRPQMIGNTNGFKKGQPSWNKGVKGYKMKVKTPRYTQTQRDNISKTLKRKYASGELVAVIPKIRRGEEHPSWKGGDARFKCIDCGKQISSNTSKRCRKCYSKANSGENNNRWKGGITSENHKIRNSVEYDIWRKSVYERDYWTCQICGKKCGKDIIAHHIFPFSDYFHLRFSINNGITLCRSCHTRLHHNK